MVVERRRTGMMILGDGTIEGLFAMDDDVWALPAIAAHLLASEHLFGSILLPSSKSG
jgi:hypothetical protein